ncbi:LEAF RUST 10 DISEASE-RESISTANCEUS RECEPTOR-LIKE PROTEIN KINASE-like 2.3 [Primulina huaijiensis]|uniref:LEAF RUST 10 DISEASE-RESISTANCEUS RECEPTOR-LIKE PROTEIN KINASE-like 2.3 n=1 Tax=Primulina huaijiensis TaxID=1492673 RepID=UPI003CC76952
MHGLCLGSCYRYTNFLEIHWSLSMLPQNSRPKSSLFTLIISLCLIRSSASSSLPNNTNYTNYTKCREPFQCGNLGNISYPFWGGDRPISCGYPGFKLICVADRFPLLNISSIIYSVLHIDNATQTLKIARQDLSDTVCPKFFFNTTLDFKIFQFSPTSNDQNITMYYGCNMNQRPLNQFSCTVNGTNRWNNAYVIRETELSGSLRIDMLCDSSISVPISQNAYQALQNATNSTPILQEAFDDGFSIQWSANNDLCETCVISGGVCGYNQDSRSFTCNCIDRPHPFVCNSTRTGNGSRKVISGDHKIKYIILGVSLGISIIVISSMIKIQRNLRKTDKESRSQCLENYIQNHGSIAPKRYRFNEIKKISKSFTDKLGQGGHGSVYRGTLPDGRYVAVKVLVETNSGYGEEFINEVVSISRTSHVNIITLLGFCLDKNKRALVYEFMPNKSLDKFISIVHLEWEKLYKIAVGVARGLEYLHRGCNTRIVHFDIKPQNILLDEDFCPKISDFGLAKLCQKQESILSILGARGTAGYIAPEVFFRNIGGVSHKSDVYSYGMMVLEMVGAIKFSQVDDQPEASENYFPDKIYEDMMVSQEKKLEEIMGEEEHETIRKMFLVGFWCIQTSPSDRPSMTKVVEMLEGSVQCIHIPPKPVLFSPTFQGRELPSSSKVNYVTDYSN